MNLNSSELCNAIEIGLVIVDHELKILCWNNWMVKHSKVSLSSVLNKKLTSVFREENAKVLFQAIEHTIAYRTSSILSAALHRSLLPLFNPHHFCTEQRIYQTITTTGLYLPDSPPLCLIQVIDASTTIKREKVLRDYSDNLKQESVTDGLTGLSNRRFFDTSYLKTLSISKSEQVTVSILMIDIDFFKLYNDFYGHQAGDTVIHAVASVLKSQISGHENTVARYGGEEFVIILPNTSKTEAEVVAERLNNAVRALNIPHQKSEIAPYISISIGICSGIPLLDENMLLKADEELYTSKRGGRNRWSSVSL